MNNEQPVTKQAILRVQDSLEMSDEHYCHMLGITAAQFADMLIGRRITEHVRLTVRFFQRAWLLRKHHALSWNERTQNLREAVVRCSVLECMPLSMLIQIFMDTEPPTTDEGFGTLGDIMRSQGEVL